jgi:hypothetical protein
VRWEGRPESWEGAGGSSRRVMMMGRLARVARSSAALSSRSRSRCTASPPAATSAPVASSAHPQF